MPRYFHCRTGGYSARGKAVILCTAAFCAEICVAAFFVLIFNYCTTPDHGTSVAMLTVICAALAYGMTICLLAAELSLKKVRRHSRYTYLDVQQKGFVLSVYAGEYRIMGKKAVLRDLYYVPFRGITLAELCEDGKNIVITGEIRHFCMNSDNLGYHIVDGDFDFDRSILNVSGFDAKKQLRLPPVFGKPADIMRSLSEAYSEWRAIPAPKPRSFHEADFIRRRPKARAMPENFDYRREWK